jgi:hypothetical protein
MIGARFALAAALRWAARRAIWCGDLLMRLADQIEPHL